MSISTICKPHVVTAPQTTTIEEAAMLMKRHNIGNIIITESAESPKPVGILTDRDIAMKIVADGLEAKNLSVCDVMSNDLLLLKCYQADQEALDMMCARGVRRAPVVDENNRLIGILAMDDLLVKIAEQLSSLAKLIRKQITH